VTFEAAEPALLYAATLQILRPALREAIQTQERTPWHPDRVPKTRDGLVDHPKLLLGMVKPEQADRLISLGQGMYAIGGADDPGNKWLIDLHGKNAPNSEGARRLFYGVVKACDEIARITKRTPFNRPGIQRVETRYEEPPRSEPGFGWITMLHPDDGGGLLLFPKQRIALDLKPGNIAIYSRDDSPAITPVQDVMFLLRSHRPPRQLERTLLSPPTNRSPRPPSPASDSQPARSTPGDPPPANPPSISK